MKNATTSHATTEATLTTTEVLWLAESGRFVRMVVEDQGGQRRCIQGIGCPKTSRLLGKAKNGVRL